MPRIPHDSAALTAAFQGKTIAAITADESDSEFVIVYFTDGTEWKIDAVQWNVDGAGLQHKAKP